MLCAYMRLRYQVSVYSTIGPLVQCLTMVVVILLTLSHEQNRKIVIYRIWFLVFALENS